MVLLLCCITVILHLVGLPWWIIFIVVALVSFLKPAGGKRSLLRGFLSVFISWFVLCTWSGIQNDHIMASRIASLLGLPGWIFLAISTAILGGLLGALAGMAGNYAYRWIAAIRSKFVLTAD